MCSLHRELLARIPTADDTTPPESWSGWQYYTRLPAGADFPLYCRTRAGGHNKNNNNTEQVLIDQNRLADEHGKYTH
eukprot:jgi/Chlat1/8571/Chrsp82S07956